MRLLLDTNVLLDVLLNRDPWASSAARLLSAIELERAHGFVAGHTLPTVYYVTAQARNRKTAAAAVADLLRFLDVASLARADFLQALQLPMQDFEDAVQAAAALSIAADYIVTRNENDFRGGPVRTADPPTVLALL